MRASTGLWCLLGSAVLAGLVVGGVALSPPPSASEIVDAEGPDAGLVAEAELKGTGTPAKPAYGDVTDLRTLLQATWAGNDAENRLTAIAAADPKVASEIAAWLGPAHDLERRPPLPPGTMRSGAPDVDLQCVCHALGRLGERGVAALVAGLNHEEPTYRARMAECLGRLGASAASAVPALLARLDGDREDAYGQAVVLRALGQMGPAAAQALPVFEAYLRDERYPDEARAAAAEGYLDLGGVTDATLATCAAALQDQSFEVCSALIPALSLLGERAKPVVPALVALVADADAHDLVVMRAVWAIGAIGVVDRTTVALLLEIALGDRRVRGYRSTAVHALVNLGPDSTSALLDAASAEGDDVRLRIARTLASDVQQGDVRVQPVLDLLTPIRGSEWEDDRSYAVDAAFALKPTAGLVVDWLSPWLADRHPDVRRAAVYGLSQLWDPDGRVAPVLARATTDANASVRLEAVRALLARAEGELGDREHLRRKPVADALAARLDDPDDPHDELAVAAAYALNEVAPERNVEALPVWIRILEDDDWHSDPDAAQVLGGLGPRAAAAIPALELAVRLRERWPAEQKRFQAALEAIRGR